MSRLGTYVLFTIPKENLEDFYDWLIEIANTPQYKSLGLDIKNMITPILLSEE